MLFRLYRKSGAPLSDLTEAQRNNPLGGVRQAIRDARQFIREEILTPLQGRVLEREIPIVLILERMDSSTDVRTHFSYTSEGYHLDTPFLNAKGVTHFRISGRTHWTPVLVNGVPVDGDSALKDLKELVEEYFWPSNGGTTADYELVWINLLGQVSAEDPFGDLEWTIHPLRGVQTHKQSQRPHQTLFSFEFLGLQSNRDLAKSEDGFLAGLMSRGFLKRLLGLVPGGAELAGVLDGIFGTLDELRGFLDDVGNVVTAVNDYVHGATQLIQASFAKVRGLLTSAQTIIGRIEEGWELARNLPDVFGEQLKLLRQNWPGLTSDPGSAHLATGQMRALRDVLAALVAQPQSFQNVVQSFTLPQSIAVRVPSGITIERMAQRNNVEVDTLLEANRLEYPFVDSRERPEKKIARIEGEIAELTQRDVDRAAKGLPPQYVEQLATLNLSLFAAEAEAQSDPALPHVLYAGDEIRIPQPRGQVVPSVVGIETNRILSITGREAIIEAVTGQPVTEEDRLFGIDLYLNENGDLEWDEDRKDLRLVRGLSNIQVAHERYVAIPLGSLRFAPGIGNFAYEGLGQWWSEEKNQLLAFAMSKTLAQDPRVRRVLNMRVDMRAGVATLVFRDLLINGEHSPELRVPVS